MAAIIDPSNLDNTIRHLNTLIEKHKPAILQYEQEQEQAAETAADTDNFLSEESIESEQPEEAAGEKVKMGDLIKQNELLLKSVLISQEEYAL